LGAAEIDELVAAGVLETVAQVAAQPR